MKAASSAINNLLLGMHKKLINRVNHVLEGGGTGKYVYGRWGVIDVLLMLLQEMFLLLFKFTVIYLEKIKQFDYIVIAYL